jgi:transcriptional regulator with GAF, ATPase, and Fis domain
VRSDVVCTQTVSPAESPSLVRLQEERNLYRQERDLYRRLLELGRQTALEPLLRDALALIVDVVAARQGYLELRADDDPADDDAPTWWIAHALSADEIAGVRASISRGILATAVASGKTVVTTSAELDPRFAGRDSVARGRIREVLCVPVGDDVPCGALYLQGKDAPGGFTAEDRERAEIFAGHLGGFACRLLVEESARRADDPVRPLRDKLLLDGIVGRSPALAHALQQAALVAPLDVHVLLTGESGTGKSQLARVVHDSGPRARGPFVEVNCGALPETLVESELFGALPGAHSTASRKIEGKVGAAEGGTLFLDEIADLAPSAQAKLLQLLQTREYYPLGASRAVHADVRLVAATNTDLKRAVAERRFREDLFYRLAVLPIRVPTLAERRADIPDLVRHFAAAAGARLGLGPLEASQGVVRAAELADWPGNVRQLAHAIEAAAIRAGGDGVRRIERKHFHPDPTIVPAADAGPPTFQEATRRFQAKLVRETLAATDWNVPEAARRLDLARSHVYNLIRVFAITRDK